jgi:hypothetical protein
MPELFPNYAPTGYRLPLGDVSEADAAYALGCSRKDVRRWTWRTTIPGSDGVRSGSRKRRSHAIDRTDDDWRERSPHAVTPEGRGFGSR